MYDGTTKGEYRIMLQGVGNKVFRYGSASEESIQAFADERLYLSAPVVFNGPFESDMYVNFHEAWERVTYELERYERDYLGGKNKDGFQIVTPFNRGLFMEIIDDPEKKKEFEEKVRREVIDTTEKLGENGRLADFYEDYLSDSIWMEQGDRYRGFALMYDKNKLENGVLYDGEERKLFKKASFKKVSYTETRHDFGTELFKLLTQKSQDDVKRDLKPILLQTLVTKNKGHALEKEWRLCSLPDDIELQNEVSYMSVKPEAVFVGTNIEYDLKLELCRIAKKKKTHVYEVYADPATQFYRLNFRKVDYKALQTKAATANI